MIQLQTAKVFMNNVIAACSYAQNYSRHPGAAASSIRSRLDFQVVISPYKLSTQNYTKQINTVLQSVLWSMCYWENSF